MQHTKKIASKKTRIYSYEKIGFSKDQLISEQINTVLNFPKMQRNIARISTLASKMSQIKQVKAHYHPD